MKHAMIALTLALAGTCAIGSQAMAQGQQMTQPSPTQNQSQMQTNQAQQPPNAKVNPPSVAAAKKPNPHPELAK